MKSATLSMAGVLVLAATVAETAEQITTCGELSSANTTYELQNDVSSDGDCFVITAPGVILDLGGHTVTFDDSAPVVVPNGDFEQGTGATASDWDFSAARDAQRVEGSYVQPVEVHSGQYAISFDTSNGSQHLRSTRSVTLRPNTQYSLSLMAENNVSDDVALYAEFEENTDIRAERKSKSDDGFFYVSTSFTTGSSPPAYRLRVGISGSAIGTVRIDSVRIQPHAVRGVTFGTDSVWADNAGVRNGAILQGTGGADDARGVLIRRGHGVEVANLEITVYGADAMNVSSTRSNDLNIYDNMLYNDVRAITNRHVFDGAVIWVEGKGGEIYRNTIVGGAQSGIRVDGTDPASPIDIFENHISLTSLYTNDFAIQLWGDAGSLVHHNVIDCGAGAAPADCQVLPGDPRQTTMCASCRGIFAGGGSDQTQIFENVVTVQQLPRNQEYDGCQLGGSYAFQIESGTDVDIYENTFVGQAEACKTVAFRANPGTRPTGGNSARRNNFAVVRGADTSLDAQHTRFTNLGSTLSQQDNAELTGLLTSILVRDKAGIAVADVAVSIKDARNEEVFAGTTDRTGQVVVALYEIVDLNGSQTSLTPHTVSVTVGDTIHQESITADKSQSLVFEVSRTTGPRPAPPTNVTVE